MAPCVRLFAPFIAAFLLLLITGIAEAAVTVPGSAGPLCVQCLTGPFDLFVGGTQQYSSEKLLTSGPFSLGGLNYGSAYDGSKITGARAELRMDSAFQTPIFVQPYVFYDTGNVRDPGNAAGADPIESLSSAGAGLHFTLDKNFFGSVEVAAPLTHDAGTPGGRHPRVFGALTWQF
jgi:hemolysin activation/secretion protein